jgi:hypothetical protein
MAIYFAFSTIFRVTSSGLRRIHDAGYGLDEFE